MSVVREALAELLAELPAPSSSVLEDEGFGSDLSCADDLTADMAELDTDDPLVVAQAVYRRLTTPRGGLIDDPDYGLDVRSFLHKGMTPAEVRAIAGQIRLEILKDERVLDAEVRLRDVSMRRFTLEIACVTATGPFELTGPVTAEGFVASIVNRGE